MLHFLCSIASTVDNSDEGVNNGDVYREKFLELDDFQSLARSIYNGSLWLQP